MSDLILGYLHGTVNLIKCGNDLDLIINIFEYETNTFIGTYTLNSNGSFIVENLDTSKHYNIILEDRNKILEQQIRSYRVPLSYPYNLTIEYDKVEKSIKTNWLLNSDVDEQRYYCENIPISIDNLPLPKKVLSGNIKSYSDLDIDSDNTYYIVIGHVKNNIEKFSVYARTVSRDITNNYLRLNFNESLIYDDVSNKVCTNTEGVNVQNKTAVFSVNGLITSPVITLNSDFIISADIELDEATGDYMNIFNIDGLILRFGNIGFGYKLQFGINSAVLSGVYSCALTQSDFVGAGFKNVKFSRIGGICTLKVDDVIQNIGKGANPTVYPLSSFTDNNTQIGENNSIIGNQFKGIIKNFEVLKS